MPTRARAQSFRVFAHSERRVDSNMEYRLKSPTFHGTGSTSVSVPGAVNSVSLSIKEGVVTIPADEAHREAVLESLQRDGFIDITARTSHTPKAAPKKRNRGERLGAVLLAPSGQFSGDTFVKTESGQKAVPVYNGACIVYGSDIEHALTREGWRPGPEIYSNDLAPEASEGEGGAE